MTTGLLFVLTALLNTGALALIRLAGPGVRWSGMTLSLSLRGMVFLVGGVLAYALAFLLTVRLLSLSRFGMAVPVFVGLQFLFSLLTARFVFHESLTWMHLGGALLILGGIALVAGGR